MINEFFYHFPAMALGHTILVTETTCAEIRDAFFAAGGGMLAPAAVYLALTAGNQELSRGWAIPTATAPIRCTAASAPRPTCAPPSTIASASTPTAR